MKINTDTALKNLEGRVLTREGHDDGTPWTLGHVAADALLAPQQGSSATPASVVERYTLATRLFRGGELELTAQEIATVQIAVAAQYAPLVAGQVILLTDGHCLA